MIDTVFSATWSAVFRGAEAGGWEIVKRYVELGLGVSIVTEVCLTGHEKIAVIPLNEYFSFPQLWPDCAAGQAHPQAGQAFTEMFDDEFFNEELWSDTGL